MNLSKYLSDDEWDAVLYLAFGEREPEPPEDQERKSEHIAKPPEVNLGQAMERGIQRMIAEGYSFEALNDKGEVDEEVEPPENINFMKLRIFSGNPFKLDLFEHIAGGRDFVLLHTPNLVYDTQEEFEEQIRTANEKMRETNEKRREEMRRVRDGQHKLPIPSDVVVETLKEGDRVYKGGRLVGTVRAVVDGSVWVKIDQMLFDSAPAEGELTFGFVLAKST